MTMNKAMSAAIAALLALAAIVALLGLGLSGCGSNNTNTTRVSETNSSEERFNAERGYAYIITDTKTDVQCLAWRYGDGGGVCVLVDADGKPLLAGDAE